MIPLNEREMKKKENEKPYRTGYGKQMKEKEKRKEESEEDWKSEDVKKHIDGQRQKEKKKGKGWRKKQVCIRALGGREGKR